MPRLTQTRGKGLRPGNPSHRLGLCTRPRSRILPGASLPGRRFSRRDTLPVPSGRCLRGAGSRPRSASRLQVTWPTGRPCHRATAGDLARRGRVGERTPSPAGRATDTTGPSFPGHTSLWGDYSTRQPDVTPSGTYLRFRAAARGAGCRNLGTDPGLPAGARFDRRCRLRRRRLWPGVDRGRTSLGRVGGGRGLPGNSSSATITVSARPRRVRHSAGRRRGVGLRHLCGSPRAPSGAGVDGE